MELKYQIKHQMAQQYVVLSLFRPTNLQKDFQFKHFLTFFHKSSIRKFDDQIQMIDKDVTKGRTDFSVFSYSLREYFFTIQQSVQEKHLVRNNIANVLYAIAARYDRVGYCQGMSSIAAFLLCFSKEETAFTIFSDMIENIFPPMFFEKSAEGIDLIGLQSQIFFLKEYFAHIVKNVKKALLMHERQPFLEQQIEFLQNIIQIIGMKSLLNLFIGMLSFSNLIFIWQELSVKRSFEVFEKTILALVYLSRNIILEVKNFRKIEEYFSSIDVEHFKEVFFDIQIDSSIKKDLISKFYQQNTNKWNNNIRKNSYHLSKATSFNQQEIKIIQNYLTKNIQDSDLSTRVIADIQTFLGLVKIYYDILKENCPQNLSVLQISPYFLKKIFQSSEKQDKNGFNFKQFTVYFSKCTKSPLKNRICEIIKTYQNEKKEISFQNFRNILDGLASLIPEQIHNHKQEFMQRVTSYFSEGMQTIKIIESLLNDQFINEVALYICSECPRIIENTFKKYAQLKNND